MSDEPAAALLAWFDDHRRGDVDALVRHLDHDRNAVLRGLETLVDLDLVAAEPRRGTYALTRRGRLVATRYESTDDATLEEVAADVEPDQAVVDATAGP